MIYKSSKNKTPYLKEWQQFALNLRIWSIYRFVFSSRLKNTPRVKRMELVLGQPRDRYLLKVFLVFARASSNRVVVKEL